VQGLLSVLQNHLRPSFVLCAKPLHERFRLRTIVRDDRVMVAFNARLHDESYYLLPNLSQSVLFEDSPYELRAYIARLRSRLHRVPGQSASLRQAPEPQFR
jgi:hypothetical protein